MQSVASARVRAEQEHLDAVGGRAADVAHHALVAGIDGETLAMSALELSARSYGVEAAGR